MRLHRFLACILLLTASWCPQVVLGQTSPDPPDDIVINQLHLFVMPLADRLQITEYYLLGNTGASTYEGTENATVVFTLPDSAENVQFDEIDRLNERYQFANGRIIDSLPVPPGEATLDVRFTYELPYVEGQPVVRSFDMPTEAIVVMVMGEGMAVESQQLMSMGPLSTEQATANAYAARRPLEAGETLTFAVAQVAGRGAAPTQLSTSWEIGLGALALAVAVALSYRRLTRQPSSPPSLPDESRPLVEALAELEDAYAAGNLADTEYQRERAKLRSALRQSLREARDDD